MVKRGLVVDPSCPISGFHSKDVHILRDCNAAKDVWSQLLTGCFYDPGRINELGLPVWNSDLASLKEP
ncbi:hypothetical protein J1N35_002774 [Gossypium stocksii]|uniref:Reverse transcriptase zinc-binding domain-containing protein n=1 Tax=Gossypium stocksii TaxID=47602 RepID=A0A9D3WMF4_9ROSI|nr:hypothetical protein J1N35_002774 [Gossypium stocksii]